MVKDDVKGLLKEVMNSKRYLKYAGGLLMHLAIDMGDIVLIDQLIKECGYIDSPNEEGYTPLHLAVFNGDLAVTKLLLLGGANPNFCCLSTYESPLHFAAIHGDKSLMMLLLKHGADVNLCNRKKITPLEELLNYRHEQVFIDLFKEFGGLGNKIENKVLIKCFEASIMQDLLEAKSLIRLLLF